MYAFDAAGMGTFRGKQVNEFICNATGYFGNMDDGSLRAGVMEGKCKTKDIFLHEFDNKEEMVAELRKEFEESKSLDQIIYDMFNEGFNETRGGREDSKKLAIVFVDESTENMDAVTESIVLARSKLIEVFVVVIGEHNDISDLYEVVDEPPVEHITIVENHKKLNSIQGNFNHMLCKRKYHILKKNKRKIEMLHQ